MNLGVILVALSLLVIYFGTFVGLLLHQSQGACVGAAFDFSIFSFLLVVSFVVFSRFLASRCELADRVNSDDEFLVTSRLLVLLAFQVGFVLILVLFFRGLESLTGQLFRGDLRVSFGPLGWVRGVICKWLQPSLFAMACFLFIFRMREKTFFPVFLVVASGLLTYFSGLTMGSKTGGLLSVAPGMTLLLWFPGRRQKILLFTLLLLSGIVALLGTKAYDSYSDISSGSRYLFRRATIIQAEPVCRIWDRYYSGVLNSDYGKLFVGALGRIGSQVLLGVDSNSRGSVEFDFSKSMSVLVYGEKVDIQEGKFNVTVTVFIEALVAFGRLWWLGAVFVGFVLALAINLLKSSIKNIRPDRGSILVVWLYFGFITWVNSGGFMYLLHPAPLVGMALSWALCHALSKKPTSKNI